MTNIALLRKIMIVLLAVSTVIVVGMILKNSIENGANVSEDEVTQEEQVEIKSTTELIAEQKFAIVELTEGGFLESSIDVPLGGVLQINNSTSREIMFDIRAENYRAGLIVKAGETGYSPVFTQAGEYTMSEFVDGEINEEISTKVNVIK